MYKVSFRGLFNILTEKIFNTLQEAKTYILLIGYESRQYKIEAIND